MTEQDIYLERYDWTVHVLYAVRSRDAMYVRRCLRDLGCKGIPLEDASNLVLAGEANKGITYSNINRHETVVVIGWTTSLGEYTNSLTQSACGLSAFSSDCLQRFYAVTITSQLFFAQFRLYIS